ncbi:MAG: hypothetical protein BWY65_00748 [Firmicutes bacterium ADurb.Bin373]|nr:hypothetical protein [Bacillota bacterium]OQA10227.1 MAG: hypothetical protein BWY65_00748 [Firmicutes bacterium ADurb.Bin373]
MKIEKCFKIFCHNIRQDVDVKILVHLAERWCGYNIIELSECTGQKACGVERCEIIHAEEEKAADQLIADYLEQQKIRDQIRENLKYSNQ